MCTLSEQLAPESENSHLVKYRKELDDKLYTPIVPVISKRRDDEFHKYWVSNFYDRFGSLESTAHCIYHTQQLLCCKGLHFPKGKGNLPGTDSCVFALHSNSAIDNEKAQSKYKMYLFDDMATYIEDFISPLYSGKSFHFY